MNRIIFTIMCLISILSGTKAQDLVLSDSQSITFNADYINPAAFYHADLAIDSKGNKILVGQFDGSNVYFDTANAITSYKSDNVFIAKYDTSGNIIWLKNIGGNTSKTGWSGMDRYSTDKAFAVKTDADDNIYVLGKCNVSTNEVLDFDDNHPETESREDFSYKLIEVFLAKYSSEGKLIWKRLLGDDFADSAFDLVLDAKSNVWITGVMQGFTANVIDFDLKNEYDDDRDELEGQFAHLGFMACYGANGDFKMVKGTGESGLFSNIGIGVSEAGNVYMAGSFCNTISFFLNDSTPHIIKNQGRTDLHVVDPDIVLLKYNSADSIEWIKTIGSSSYNEVNSIVIDDNENIYITGYFTGTNVDFDTENDHAFDLQTSASNGSSYIAKYDHGGELLWVNVVEGGISSKGRSLLIADTMLVATGEVKGSSAHFGDVTLSSLASNSNGYLALMTTNGDWIDAIAFESSKFSSIIDAEIGSNGMFYAVGFNGTIYDGQVDAEELSIFNIKSATIDSKLVSLVEFKDWDGTVLKQEHVFKGKAATPPADPIREGFTFSGWSVDYDSVTANLEVSALYREEEKVWHQVPNGDFESWTLYDEGIAGCGDYWLPDSGWTENFQNIATRFYNSAGYFYRYEESDANGYALKLQGSGPSANGFIRFRCDEVPISLKGQYKFSNTGCDDFTIYVYAINSADTIPHRQLYEGIVHSSAKSFVAPITESFQDFEIDLSDFKDVDIDYFVIMFSVHINRSCTKTLPAIGDVFTNDPNGFVVVDDLELVYDTLTSVNDELNLTDLIKVYPNPVKDIFQIEFNSLHDDAYIQLYSTNGNLLSVKLVEQRLTTIDMSTYSPGVYMLQVVNGNRKEMVKILKE